MAIDLRDLMLVLLPRGKKGDLVVCSPVTQRPPAARRRGGEDEFDRAYAALQQQLENVLRLLENARVRRALSLGSLDEVAATLMKLDEVERVVKDRGRAIAAKEEGRGGGGSRKRSGAPRRPSSRR